MHADQEVIKKGLRMNTLMRCRCKARLQGRDIVFIELEPGQEALDQHRRLSGDVDLA